MPNPTASDVHVNRPLTNISIAYMQNNSMFVADRVFPNIPVNKQSDRYFRYDRADFHRNQMKKRAPSTESAGGGYKVDSTPNYFCDDWGLHKDIDDDVRDNEDAPLNSDRDATVWLGLQALISREVNFVSAYMSTGVWTGIDGTNGDITGVAATPGTREVLQWNDASSTPIEDVTEQCTNIQQLTGFRPNKLTLGRQVWDKLKNHPDIVDRIKYSGGVGPGTPAVVTRAAVAALMELDEILVADGIQVTSKENKDFETSMTAAFIAGKQALLSYSAPTPSIMMPSAGYTFSWKGKFGASRMGQRIRKFRMESLKSDRVESDMYYDQKLVASDCGVLFTSIVA